MSIQISPLLRRCLDRSIMQLAEEFRGVFSRETVARYLEESVAQLERSPELIRGCADRVLDDYDHVPVRSHILTLAHKRTRDCLKQEHREILEESAG